LSLPPRIAALPSHQVRLPPEVAGESVLPERHATSDPGLVGHDGDVRVELEVDLLGVAAADVEVIEVRQGPEVVDRPPHPLVPLLLADFLASGVAELLVVRLALAERMVRQLEVRPQPAVEVEAGPEAGAEGDDH